MRTDEMRHGEFGEAPEESGAQVTRRVEVDASPEEVFEALVTEEGRERWLEEPGRQVHIESADPPHRLVWWWTAEDEPFTRVDFEIVAVPAPDREVPVTRVTVRESAPRFPIAQMAASFALVAA
jgi:uncharacterized protein YndB with AHSA1/START domain